MEGDFINNICKYTKLDVIIDAITAVEYVDIVTN